MSAPAGKTGRFNCSVAVNPPLPSLAAHDDPALVKKPLSFAHFCGGRWLASALRTIHLIR